MKKYKHKKTGTIAEKMVNPCNSYRAHFSDEKMTIPKQFIEDSCDWEEIIEKAYEILVLKCPQHNNLYTKKENGKFSLSEEKFGHASEEDAIKFGWNIIHSIKRLSDGEVFTIGDMYRNLSGVFTIESFHISKKENIIVQSKENGSCMLDCIVKEKVPLFITEDGIDIEDEKLKVSIVYNNFNINHGALAKYALELVSRYGGKIFSTKEKAEEYVLMNKKSLSINELQNIFLTAKCLNITNVNDITNHAITIVKSRNEK